MVNGAVEDPVSKMLPVGSQVRASVCAPDRSHQDNHPLHRAPSGLVPQGNVCRPVSTGLRVPPFKPQKVERPRASKPSGSHRPSRSLTFVVSFQALWKVPSSHRPGNCGAARCAGDLLHGTREQWLRYWCHGQLSD